MMEFEEDHEEEDQEDEEDEEEMPLPATFKFLDNKPAGVPPPPARYRECLKNHAVGIGGQAVDGCGEFMPAGAEGTLDGLKCAACNCHRNFHRKELLPLNPSSLSQNQRLLNPFNPRLQYPPRNHHGQAAVYNFYPYNSSTSTRYLQVAQARPLELPSATGGGEVGGGMITGTGKKRFRTKFTQEQKEKMVELAEKLGWRIHKEDEEVVQQFCQEMGVKRQVLKVWLHNNKHTIGKKP